MRLFFEKEKFNVEGDKLISTMDSLSRTTQLVVGALLGSIAFLLQSAGAFAGIGYLLSMTSTGPIVLASLLSFRIGMMTYLLTILLLAMFQPGELLVFPFTTGLLGVSLGLGLKYLKRSILIIPLTGLCLTLGICMLLYGFKFPILGPSVTSHLNWFVTLTVFAFSLLYSWIWKILSVSSIKLLSRIFTKA